MMIDSSAVLSVFYDEDDAELLLAKARGADRLLISSATLVEVVSAVLRNDGRESAEKLESLIAALGIQVVPFDEAQSVLARSAYARYGRGMQHPAKLNLGDCFSYALAMRMGEPLLFKGNDFVHTDVLKA
jgi:ribonuclease VapC